MRNLLSAAAVVGLVALASCDVEATEPVGGAPICGNVVEMAEHLAKKYREKPVVVGIQANGNLLTIYASPDGRTWTLLSTAPNGTSCVAAIGSKLETAPVVPGGTPA